MNPRLMSQAEPLPGYRLIERLGRGGYGEVWKAEAPGGLFKAIKFVYGDLNNAGDDHKPAEQELKALNRVKTIRHPYILSIERFDVVDGQLLIVMELADRNLWDRFQECRGQGLVGIPQDELLRYLDEICEALDLMNGHYQIQHLDIKPQNLFLVHNHIKVADFGLAKDFEGVRATVTGGVTPVYAAPETFEGWVSRFSDQYSLAIVYQELLTGVRPFSGTNTRHLLMQHISAPPDVSPLPLTQRDAIARALSKKPDERFSTCSELARALREGIAKDGSDHASPPSLTPVPTAVPQRRPTPAPVETSPAPSMRTPATMPEYVPPGSKGLPRLVTPGSGIVSPKPVRASAPVTLQKPVEMSTAVSRDLGAAHPEFVGDGVLFPVYMVGVGLTGLRVMRRLRSQLYERTGQSSLPHWKWLYIDTDARGVQAATTSEQPKVFDHSEVYHAKLQRPAHYLKSHGLPSVDQWMSSEMLYRIPREPATEGIRALGRLALLDHYRAISQHIRRDLETFQNNGPLEEADRLLKVGIRSNVPRVYLAASLCGGTGSGMLIDLAYILRNELQRAGFRKSQVCGMLLVPPVDKTTPKNLGVANACATLAEIDHYGRPGQRFQARFDTGEPPVADTAPPFDRCMLLTLPRGAQGASPALPNADRAAGMICQEALSPLGRRVDDARARRPAKGSRIHSFGYTRLVWPRQLLLNLTTQRFAVRTLQRWSAKESPVPDERLTTEVDEFWRKSELDQDSMRAAVDDAVAAALGAPPDAILEKELRPFIENAPESDPTGLYESANRIFQWVGTGITDEERAIGKLQESVDSVGRAVGKEKGVRFAKMAVQFAERPDLRFAAAEAGVRLCTERLRLTVDQLQLENDTRARQLQDELLKVRNQVAFLAEASSGSSDRRKSQLLSDAATAVQAWGRKRIEWLHWRPVINAYRRMLGNAPEYVRDITSSRQRLADLAAEMARAAEQDAKAVALHDVPVLPPSTKTLLDAADRLVAELPGERIRDFEVELQSQIRRRLEGLVSVCLSFASSGRRLKELLLEQSRLLLDAHLGRQTVTEVFFRNQPDAQAAHRAILRAFEDAEPEHFGAAVRPDSQRVFLAAPDDEWANRFRDAAEELITETEIINSPAVDEIVFFRECHDIPISDLPQAGAHAAEAVKAVTGRDRTAVFSRTDVAWQSFLKQ